MPVDVTTSVTIARPTADVWAYAVNPEVAPQWYANIHSVELLTDGELAVGSRMRFHARFLGRPLAYTYEVVEFDPGRVFTMTTHEGPFPMTTTYRRPPVTEHRESGGGEGQGGVVWRATGCR